MIVMGSPLQTDGNSTKPVRGRPFSPGVSGNPNGRPRKLDALADAVRRRADPDELAGIAIGIARDTKQSASVRIQALQWLRDSGYSRPAERHEVAVEQSAPDLSHLSDERLEAMIAEIEGRELSDGSENRRSSSEVAESCAPEVQP